METKASNKKKIIAIVAIIIIVVLMGVIYFVSTSTTAGSKTITVEVVHADESSVTYEYSTDAEYLGDVLLDEGLVEGDETDYGLYITVVDGEEADYDTDGAYWALYVNGEYGSYGADSQPIEDGDEFALVYTVY